MDSSEKSNPHALLLSSPGLGHLIPVLELGNRLATLHDFKVTILAVASRASPVESETIRAAAAQGPCEITELPPVDITNLVDPNAAVVTKLAVMMREIKPMVRSAISALGFKPTVLIVDVFGTESLTLADEISVPKYVYIASQAWFLAFSLYTPVIDKVVKGEFVDQKDPIEIPGCRPVRPDDVVDPMLDRTNQQYLEYLRIGTEMTTSDGILVNTWEELQGEALASLRDDALLGQIVKVPIYPIGPIIRHVRPAGSKNWIIDWLDRQPKESVLYISFGSGGTVSFEQMTELAWGLELSRQRFIWVVRSPTVRTGDGSFLTTGSEDDNLTNYLPEGFLDRTRESGLIVQQFAPQVEILSHKSIGGFLSHCGWNSTLESITNGVPMIAWPMYAEQRMNATLLTEELGMAARSKMLPPKGVIGREEISMLARKIMVDEEGYAMRLKAKELKHSAKKAWREEGSSYKALSEWAKRCRST